MKTNKSRYAQLSKLTYIPRNHINVYTDIETGLKCELIGYPEWTPEGWQLLESYPGKDEMRQYWRSKRLAHQRGDFTVRQIEEVLRAYADMHASLTMGLRRGWFQVLQEVFLLGLSLRADGYQPWQVIRGTRHLFLTDTDGVIRGIVALVEE